MIYHININGVFLLNGNNYLVVCYTFAYDKLSKYQWIVFIKWK